MDKSETVTIHYNADGDPPDYKPYIMVETGMVGLHYYKDDMLCWETFHVLLSVLEDIEKYK